MKPSSPSGDDPSHEGTGLRVRVIDGDTGKAVGGAEVFAAAANQLDVSERWPTAHWTVALLAVATPRRTDARGEIRLEHAQHGTLAVAARADGRFAGRLLHPRDGPEAVLVLVPDETLTVAVQGPDGAPLPGVPVVLCADVAPPLRRVARQRSDAAGLARFEHAQLLRAKRALPNPARDELDELRERSAVLTAQLKRLRNVRAAGARQDPAEVQARGALNEVRRRIPAVARRQREITREQAVAARAAPRGLDGRPTALRPDADFVALAALPQIQTAWVRVPTPTPADPVVLQLRGVTGTLRLRVLGADGAPLLGACNVQLEARHPAGALAGESPSWRKTMSKECVVRVFKPLGASWVDVAVGAGLRFDAKVRFADDDFNFERDDVEGPRGAGVHELALRMPVDLTMVSGRFVDEAGAPLAQRMVEVFVARGARRVEAEAVETDARGRFELPVRFDEHDVGPWTLEAQAGASPAVLGGRVALPARRPSQRWELGDVLLQLVPRLAFGTVRDDRGVPIGGARVALQVWSPRERGGEGRWRDAQRQSVSTAADGGYVVHGALRAERLRVQAKASRHGSESVEIVAGEGADVVLVRYGSVRVTGLMPEALPRGALRAQLLTESGKEARGATLRPRAEGRFVVELRSLRPGVYAVEIRLRGMLAPLLRVNGLQVVPGERLLDPRLQDIDLRAGLYHYDVRAVGSDGQPQRPSSPLLVRLPDQDGQLRDAAFRWRGDRVQFHASAPSVAAVVLSRGARPAEVQLAPGESVVRLTFLGRVDVQLPGLQAMVGADDRVRIVLHRRASPGDALPTRGLRAVDQRSSKSRSYGPSSFGASGSGWLRDDHASVQLMLSGTYRVRAELSRPGLSGSVSLALGNVAVQLREGRGVLVTPTLPSAAAVEGALRELAARPPARPVKGRSSGRTSRR
ncbi:MAG: hypothetical protein AAF628_25015 [Planctomycetota bacterium]